MTRLQTEVRRIESRLTKSNALDDEIQALLDEFSPEEQEELLATFEREHTFFGPHSEEDETGG